MDRMRKSHIEGIHSDIDEKEKEIKVMKSVMEAHNMRMNKLDELMYKEAKLRNLTKCQRRKDKKKTSNLSKTDKTY